MRKTKPPFAAGDKVGDLTIGARDENRAATSWGRYETRCKCGTEASRSVYDLKRLHRVTCDHQLHGQRFGKMVAIRPTGRTMFASFEWLLACDCGRKCKRMAFNLLSGQVKECPECAKKRVRAADNERRRRILEERGPAHDEDLTPPVRCRCGLALPHDPEDRIRTCTPVDDPTWRAFAEQWAVRRVQRPEDMTINARRLVRENGIQ